jgi:transcriptional regulator with XRE-family HTH domain
MEPLRALPRSVFLPDAAYEDAQLRTESLADWISRIRNAKGLSLTDVERESARHGKKIAGSYVNRIENGLVPRPSADRLRALAHGLREPEELVMAIATGRTPASPNDALEMQLLAHFRELPNDYKEDLLKIVRVFNAEHGAKGEEIKIVKKRAAIRRAS